MLLGHQEGCSLWPKLSSHQLDGFGYDHGSPPGKGVAPQPMWPNPGYVSAVRSEGRAEKVMAVCRLSPGPYPGREGAQPPWPVLIPALSLACSLMCSRSSPLAAQAWPGGVVHRQ